MNEFLVLGQLKGEPFALIMFCMLLLYKVISGIVTIVQDKYFKKPNKQLTGIAKDVALLKIYTLPDGFIEEKQEALYEYLYSGGNGDVLNHGVKHLILPYKKTWRKTVERKQKRTLDFDPKKNFEKAMATISMGVFDEKKENTEGA